jgi:LPS export ABC transporter protein LptC
MKVQKLGSKNNNRLFKNMRIAALCFGAAILLFACENNNLEKIKAFTNSEELPTVEAQNFETLFTDSGEVRFFMKTPKLLQFENEGKVFYEFPEGMELVKYDENKQIISSISSNYAKRFLSENKWEAKNNVIATNANGDTLKTEHLIWDEKEERIYTEEFVKIIRTDQVITGIGFESDQTLANWRIKQPKGTIYVTLQDESENSDSLANETNTIENNNPINGSLQFNKK